MRVLRLLAAMALLLPTTDAPARSPAPQDAGTGVAVTVTDRSGRRLPDAQVDVAGPAVLDARTDEEGQVRFTGLKPGTYRFRYRAEGFIPFEREVVVRAGEIRDERAALSAMPALPRPTAPEPETPEAPPGEPTAVVVSAFLDSNPLGRGDAHHETEIGCTAGSKVVLHQLREPLETVPAAGIDTTLYVVEGDGVLRLGDAPHALVPSTIVVIPPGIPYAIRPEGGRALAVLVTESGVRCTQK